MKNKSFQNMALFVFGTSIILYVFIEILGARFQEAAAENLAFIFLPGFAFAIYCHMRKVNTWNETLQHIGIPLGILVSTTSFLGDLQNIEEVDIMLAVAEAFYSVLYGGVLAGFGYLISLHSEKVHGSSMAGRPDLILLIGASIIFFLVVVELKSGLGAITDVRSLTIFLIPFLIVAISSGFKVEKHLLLRACMLGMLACCLISIVAWIGAESARDLGPALAIGLLGLIYGSFALLCISLITPTSNESDAAQWKTAWHTLEIYALLTLVLYAPPSLVEIVRGAS